MSLLSSGKSSFPLAYSIYESRNSADSRLNRLDIADLPNLDSIQKWEEATSKFAHANAHLDFPAQHKARDDFRKIKLPHVFIPYRMYLDHAVAEFQKHLGQDSWNTLSSKEKSNLIHPLLVQQPPDSDIYLFHKLERFLHVHVSEMKKTLTVQTLFQAIERLETISKEQKYSDSFLIHWLKQVLLIRTNHSDFSLTSVGLCEIIKNVFLMKKNRDYRSPFVLQQPLGIFFPSSLEQLSFPSETKQLIYQNLLYRLSHETVFISTEIDTQETWIIWRGIKFPFGEIDFSIIEKVFQQIVIACEVWASAVHRLLLLSGFDSFDFESNLLAKIDGELKHVVWKKENNTQTNFLETDDIFTHLLKVIGKEQELPFLKIAARTDINLATLEKLAYLSQKYQKEPFLSWLSDMLEKHFIDPELVIAISQSESNILWHNVKDALGFVKKNKDPDIFMLTNSMEHGESVSHLKDEAKSFVAGVRRKISGVAGEYCTVQKLFSQGWDGYPILVIGREVSYKIIDGNQKEKYSAVDLMIEIIGDDTVREFKMKTARIFECIEEMKVNPIFSKIPKTFLEEIILEGKNLRCAMSLYDFSARVSAYLSLKRLMQNAFNSIDWNWSESHELFPNWLFEPENLKQGDSLFGLVEVKNYPRQNIRSLIHEIEGEHSSDELEKLRAQRETHRSESTIEQFISQGILPFWTKPHHLAFILSANSEGFGENETKELSLITQAIGYDASMTFDYRII